MDHIMNNRMSLEFGQTYARIPLEMSPHIVHGDALETDWSELLPPLRGKDWRADGRVRW